MLRITPEPLYGEIAGTASISFLRSMRFAARTAISKSAPLLATVVHLYSMLYNCRNEAFVFCACCKLYRSLCRTKPNTATLHILYPSRPALLSPSTNVSPLTHLPPSPYATHTCHFPKAIFGRHYWSPSSEASRSYCVLRNVRSPPSYHSSLAPS